MSPPTEGAPGRSRHIARKVFAATLLVFLPVFTLAYWIIQIVTTGEDAIRLSGELGGMIEFLRDQPVVSFWAGIATLFALGIFLASDVTIDILRWAGFRKDKLALHYYPRAPWVHRLPTSTIIIQHKLYSPPVIFFRVELTAMDGVAHGCRVYLRDVQYWDGARFVETEYDGAHQMRFSYHEEIAEGFAPHDVSQAARLYADLISVDPIYKRIQAKWRTEYISMMDLFARHGLYRLVITATASDAEDADPLALLLLWSGSWEQTEMHAESALSAEAAASRLSQLTSLASTATEETGSHA